MAYLIIHIAIFLVIAQLLGLLLGWLLWGYVARQRGQEVISLRQRVADMHLAATRMAIPAERRPALSEPAGVLIEGDLPEAATFSGSFFQEELAPPVAEQLPEPTPEPKPQPKPIAPDLEAEVKESKIQFLEQQVRDLESVRDRLPLMQADLSDAIAGRRSAEAKFQEAKNDFEVRSSNLLAQIREFEKAAQEWERQRGEWEGTQLTKEKELATVKAHLRDLQNNQRPQAAEPLAATPAAAASIELADLRDRYQRAIKERDSLAEELEFWKQNDDNRSGDSAHSKRLAEVEEALKAKDATLQEQVARIESLLWRVAELEPFAANAARMEENLKRQESEIAGHMAMHSESTEQIRALQLRIVQFESETAKAEALKADLERRAQELAGQLETAKQALSAAELASTSQIDALKNEMQRQAEAHGAELESAKAKLTAAQQQISEQESVRIKLQHEIGEQAKELDAARMALAAAEKRLSEHKLASAEEVRKVEQRVSELAASIASMTQTHSNQMAEWQGTVKLKEEEIAAHISKHQQHENLLANLRAHVSELEVTAHKVTALEKALIDRDTEIRGLLAAHGDMHREMQGWKEYSAKLQPLADQVPVLQGTLSERESEIGQLKQTHAEKDSQLSAMTERLNAISSRLAWHQQRLQEVEPLAARVPELNRREEESRTHFRKLEEKHQTELMKLKVNSAQRLRRLRQGIT